MKHKEKVRRHRSQKPMTMGSQWRQAEDVQRKVCVMSSVAIAGCLDPRHCVHPRAERRTGGAFQLSTLHRNTIGERLSNTKMLLKFHFIHSGYRYY